MTAVLLTPVCRYADRFGSPSYWSGAPAPAKYPRPDGSLMDR
jgi:hypothetical protein